MAETKKTTTRRTGAHDTEDNGTQVTEGDGGSGIATTVIAGIAVAVFAPELLTGMAVGVAAMMAPKILPALGTVMRPLVKTVVQGGYIAVTKTREFAAEASEQVQDIVAETQAEQRARAAHSGRG